MHIINAALLLAKLDDWIKIVPIFMFLLFWVMSQIAEAKKKSRSSRPAQLPGTSPQPALQVGATDTPASADPLRQQVDDFLRRASRQTTAAQADAAAGSATPMSVRPAAADRDRIEILLAGEPTPATRPPLVGSQREVVTTRSIPQSPQPQRTPRPPRIAKPRPQSVAEHVAEHVTSAVRQIGDEASRLGERVVAADKQFDAQLQQKFDHEIGTMGDRRHLREQEQQPAAAAVVNPAVQIFDLLASPGGMRQAVVVNEILRRPEERW